MDLKTASAHALTWAEQNLSPEPELAPAAAHEDGDAWLIVLDARSYVDGHDPWSFLADAPMVLVDKTSGAVTPLPWTEGLERATGMTQRLGA